jgi:hypothetical protein
MNTGRRSILLLALALCGAALALNVGALRAQQGAMQDSYRHPGNLSNPVNPVQAWIRVA